MLRSNNLELYAPTPDQLKVHQSPFRHNVVCYGRQSGKSTYAINKLLSKAWEQTNGIFWYVGPTYRLAAQMFERTVNALGVKTRAVIYKSESHLQVQLLSGSSIYYKSGDNPGALLGETLHGAVIDECREQDERIWSHYIMPMLGTTGGWSDMLSTPNGFDWFYDMYQKKNTSHEWGGFHAPSTSNPLWTPQMIEEARSSMSEDLFAQEILAEFRDIGSGTCFMMFGNHNIVEKSPFALTGQAISPSLPILVGMDFNLNPMSWVLGQHRNRQIHYHDEIYLTRSHTPEAAEVLCQRVKGHAAGVVIIGDASGKASQRAAAGESDYTIIKQRLLAHGIPFQDRTPDSNPSIKDRVNDFNAACKSANGNISLTISPRCKALIKDIQRRKWKEGAASLAFDNSDPMAGHLSDAASYPVSVLAPVKGVGSIKMSILNRSF